MTYKKSDRVKDALRLHKEGFTLNYISKKMKLTDTERNTLIQVIIDGFKSQKAKSKGKIPLTVINSKTEAYYKHESEYGTHKRNYNFKYKDAEYKIEVDPKNLTIDYDKVRAN